MKRPKIHQRESNKDSIVIATVTEFSTIEETWVFRLISTSRKVNKSKFTLSSRENCRASKHRRKSSE